MVWPVMRFELLPGVMREAVPEMSVHRLERIAHLICSDRESLPDSASTCFRAWRSTLL